MDTRQFQLFKQITLDYFAKLAPEEAPAFGEPYLQFGEPRMMDFTSLVEIQGEYDGFLFLSSPTAMMEGLLEINGEPEISQRTLLDMSRELSNVLSGNASQAFGGNWEISVPKSLGPADLDPTSLPASTFIMPIHWRNQELLLGIGLRPAPQPS